MENLEYQKSILDKMKNSTSDSLMAVDVVFSLGDQFYKFPPGVVESISELPSVITPVPGAPSQVIGLAFVRGNSRIVMDISSWLHVKGEIKKGRHVANLRGRSESILIKLVYELDQLDNVQMLNVVDLLKQKELEHGY